MKKKKRRRRCREQEKEDNEERRRTVKRRENEEKRRDEEEIGEWDNCTEAAYRYCTVYYISTNIISDRGFTFWSFCYTTRE